MHLVQLQWCSICKYVYTVFTASGGMLHLASGAFVSMQGTHIHCSAGGHGPVWVVRRLLAIDYFFAGQKVTWILGS